LTSLRDSCPCAGCQGETVLLHTYKPIQSPESRAKYELVGAEVVGNYAMQLCWADGHREGIYTWEHLRSLCECSECSGQRAKATVK
jgi:DUF971 family protein